jgi:hypothetical protein
MTRSSDEYIAEYLTTEIASAKNRLNRIQQELAKDLATGVHADWSNLTRLIDCQEDVKIHLYVERVFTKILKDAGIAGIDGLSAASQARAAIKVTMDHCLERMMYGPSRSTNAAATMISEAEVAAMAKFYRSFRSFV